jgi:uncharacterized protein YndB with AHSA1/START domain
MAVHAEHTVTVGRPIAEVFAFLADGANNPRWRPEVSDVRLTSGPGTAAAAGACYAQTMTGPGGRTLPGDYRLTVCEAPHRLEFEVVAGPGRPTGSFALREPAPGETEVTFVLDLALPAALLPLTGTVRKLAQAEVGNLDNLQAALDS